MKLHPRALLVQGAGTTISGELDRLQEEHGLTDVEMLRILLDHQQTLTRHLLSEEHSDNPDRPADTDASPSGFANAGPGRYGKVTAAALAVHVSAVEPVRVLMVRENAASAERCGREPLLQPTNRRTNVMTLVVTDVVVGSDDTGRRTQRYYQFQTSAGCTVRCAPMQSFILAPTDRHAIQRAHVEALADDAIRRGQ
ncbi:hypothetical protein [Micromonospora sp. WMMD1082]|uniref:hypothetical protein n=1 Tax=Micromonospora sp. WMMD1082 TaxID=3016104 RepID=UPI0024171BA4|nr:hypothetical protein [Micromonospora sp. WMMD1082]MDG4796904.1 hypothetical protein [Micromonospora sp. WMMD1082]